MSWSRSAIRESDPDRRWRFLAARGNTCSGRGSAGSESSVRFPTRKRSCTPDRRFKGRCSMFWRGLGPWPSSPTRRWRRIRASRGSVSVPPGITRLASPGANGHVEHRIRVMTVDERSSFGRALRLLPRLIVAGGLTAYIFVKSHPRAVLAAAAGADWRPIGIAILLVLADRTLMAYRWVVLLCTVEPGARPP